MRKISLPLIAVALMLTPTMPAAPAPAEKDDAKVKLAALEKRLPEIVEKVEQNESAKLDLGTDVYRPKLRLVRQLSPTTAKVTMVLERYWWNSDGKTERDSTSDQIASIYLSYFDGAWTTTSVETGVAGETKGKLDGKLRWLMLVIDEDGGK